MADWGFFQWQVAPAYELVDATLPLTEVIDLQDRTVMCLVANRHSGPPRLYNPMEDARGLFQEFAELQRTPEDVLAFAKAHGSLGGRTEELVRPTDPVTRKSLAPPDGVALGEALIYWYEQIRRMRELLDIWGMVERRDEVSLSKRIRWRLQPYEHRDLPGVYYAPETVPSTEYSPSLTPPEKTIADDLLNPKPIAQGWLKYGEVIEPARWFLLSQITEQLEYHHATARFVYRPGKAVTHALQLWPDGLIGILWVQFAQAIDGHRNYQKCPECPTWFELSPDVARSDKVYCSDRCRVRASRRRKGQLATEEKPHE